MKIFEHIGKYCLLVKRIFARPEKFNVFIKQVIKEIELLGINSIVIIVIISFFIGTVATLQTALNLNNPLIPRYYIGVATREVIILEFSSTIVALILAGKVGSNITSEIGSMRISEQIDVMEMMGINSSNYLILPKITAAVFFNPFLTVISIFVGIAGGYFAAITTDVVNPYNYLYGIQYWFNPFYITYTLIKTVVFAFIITTVSAYHGYFVRGGAL